jgi:hypothetical protein
VGIAERLADPADPLRVLLQAARSWRVPPTVFLRQRTVGSTDWTDQDTSYAMALEDYEAGLCPGCNHPLAETSRPDHADAYRPEKPIRCHYCTAQALVAEVAEKDDNTAGLMFPLTLDPDVVELNRKPVPPLPPELASLSPDS